MFDVGFSELVVIAIVALVVVGPERLPKLARTLGYLAGRLNRYVSDVKADIEREMRLEELKKLQAEVEESARSMEQSLNEQVNKAEQEVQAVAASLEPVDEAPIPIAESTSITAPSTPVAADAAALLSPFPEAASESGQQQLDLSLEPASAAKAPLKQQS